MQGLEWEFAVVNSPQVNAFVVPGGKVVVYTGLMQLLKGPAQETQLAAVIGHEIAHVVARHAVRSQYFNILQQHMLCKRFAKPCSGNTAVVKHTAAHVVANNSVRFIDSGYTNLCNAAFCMSAGSCKGFTTQLGNAMYIIHLCYTHAQWHVQCS